jgi:hypothetical protein
MSLPLVLGRRLPTWNYRFEKYFVSVSNERYQAYVIINPNDRNHLRRIRLLIWIFSDINDFISLEQQDHLLIGHASVGLQPIILLVAPIKQQHASNI